jgi:hypothetical protein
MNTEQLTDAQIENWRKVLALNFGPYAFIMSKSEVQKIRNKMQGYADKDTDNFLTKTMCEEVDMEEVVKPIPKKETTFGDLIREAKQAKKCL